MIPNSWVNTNYSVNDNTCDQTAYRHAPVPVNNCAVFLWFFHLLLSHHHFLIQYGNVANEFIFVKKNVYYEIQNCLYYYNINIFIKWRILFHVDKKFLLKWWLNITRKIITPTHAATIVHTLWSIFHELTEIIMYSN